MCAALLCHCSWQVNRKIAIKVIRKCNYVTKLSLLVSIKNDKNLGNKMYSFAFSIRTSFPVGWYRRGQVMCFNRHGHAGIHTEWPTRSKGDASQKVRRNFHFPRKYYFWWGHTVLFICKAMSFIWFLAGENYFRSLTWNFFCYSSQLQPACQRGLMALCALGLVSGDATLAGAALGELMKQKDGKIRQSMDWEGEMRN